MSLSIEQQLQYAIDEGYPLQEPPEGVLPDFANGDSVAFQISITAGVCIPLMIVFSVFRLLGGTVFGRMTFVADEIVFVTGLVFCLSFIGVTLATVDQGVFGHHAWDVKLADVTQNVVALSIVLELVAPLAVCIVKISVMILYLRTFGSLMWMRVTSIVVICLLIAYHVSFATAFVALCAPPPSGGYSQVALLKAFVSDKCVNTSVLVLLMGVGNFFTDIVLLLLPLPIIWRLQMPMRRKIKTLAMFLIGISACISSLIGLVTRVRYYSIYSDQIRIMVPIQATSMAEMAAGVIICCGPSAAVVCRSIKDLPVRSWLSPPRIFGGSSHSKILLSDQAVPYNQTNKDSSLLQSIVDPRGASNDAEVDSYPLGRLEPVHAAGIGKMTEFSVSRTTN